MSLSYLRDDCHKQVVTHIRESWRFESMYTLQGKSDQHVTYASHFSSRTPDIRFLQAVPVRDNLSLAPTKSKQAPTPRRSLGNQKQAGPAIVLGGLIPPPMWHPWSRGKKFQPSGYTATSAYWAHNTSMRSVRSILARGGQPIGP
jgi:hypothetical protein